MKTALSLSLVVLFAGVASAQTKVVGRVLDPDSNAVANAVVRLLALDATQTNADGYFEFDLPQRITESHFLKGGVDVEFEVEKSGMAVLHPANRKIRLPHNWTYQDPFTIILAKKGSLLFTRSERVLDLILREKIQAAVETKEQELARRDVVAEKAQEFGLSKDTLLAAIADYKDRLRTSPDLNERGLAALDDANEAEEFRVRQQKLAEAKQNFQEAIRKDERQMQEGKAAEARLPEAYYNLGMTYFDEALYDSAAYFFAKADSVMPDDSKTMNMLGRALDELAKYDEALSFYERALVIDTAAYGRHHPNVATQLNNIAVVLRAKGNHAGALEKLLEAYQIDQAYFGKSSHKVAIRLNNIAAELHAKGDYSLAIKNYEEALVIFETANGRTHPNFATVLDNLGTVLESKGDFAGALEKHHEALKILKTAYGREHPDVAKCLSNIASVLYEKGEYSMAQEKYQEVLKIVGTIYGRKHPNTAISLDNLGTVLESKGNYAGALEKYQEALKIFETAYGRDHPDVATSLNNIAGALRKKGDYAAALEKYQEALKIDEAYFGRNHPKVAIRLNNIGAVLESKGDYAKALDKYQEALTIDEAYFGRNHPNVARELNNIGEVLHAKGDHAGALEKYQEALTIDEAYLGRNHPDVARELNNIGEVLHAKGDYRGALEEYQGALMIFEIIYGREHPNVATTLNNIGEVLRAKGDYAGAMEKYQEALKIFERIFGQKHPTVATVLNNIAALLLARGDYGGALEYCQEALQILENLFGPDHPNTRTARENLEYTKWHSLPGKERWRLQTQSYLTQLKEASAAKNDSLILQLLNQAGVGYIKQEKADSALIYLQQALPLAQKLRLQFMLGTLYNNLGAAFKLQRNWSQAQDYLHRSLSHNRAAQGDSASVLAYSYFYLAGVHLAQSHADSARIYAQKSLGLATHHELSELQDDVKSLMEQLEQVSAKESLYPLEHE